MQIYQDSETESLAESSSNESSETETMRQVVTETRPPSGGRLATRQSIN